MAEISEEQVEQADRDLEEMSKTLIDTLTYPMMQIMMVSAMLILFMNDISQDRTWE